MIYRFLPRLLIIYSIHNIGIIHTCICDRCNVKFHFSTTWYRHIVFIYTVTWWSTNSWSDLSKNCFCLSKVFFDLNVFISFFKYVTCAASNPAIQLSESFSDEKHRVCPNIGVSFDLQQTGLITIHCYCLSKIERQWSLYRHINRNCINIYFTIQKEVNHVHLYMFTCTFQYINSKCFVAHTLAFMMPWIHCISKFSFL